MRFNLSEPMPRVFRLDIHLNQILYDINYSTRLALHMVFALYCYCENTTVIVELMLHTICPYTQF